MVFAEVCLAQNDIFYSSGDEKEHDSAGSATVKNPSVITDTFGVQDTRGSEGKLTAPHESKTSSPFYTNSATKSDKSPESPSAETIRESSPFYTNSSSRKSSESPGFEIRQRPKDIELDHYSGSEVKSKDFFGSETMRRSSDFGTEVYGTSETRGMDSGYFASQKNNAGDSLFGVSQITKTTTGDVTVINHPQNIHGLTGLLITNSAFSMPSHTVSIGASFLLESSNRPKFDALQVPLTITYGITDEMELGIKTKSINIDDKSGKVPKKSSGFGDTELLLKGRIIDQRENFPAFAIGVGGILPTGKESEQLNEVTHWGAKFIMVTTSEAPVFDEHLLGLYIEGQMVFIDEFTKYGSHAPTAERYGVINAGVLMPIAFDNRLHAILEYNAILRKNRPTLNERDFGAVTPSVRYVSRNFSATFGIQFLEKKKAKYEDTVRYIGTVSYMF